MYFQNFICVSDLKDSNNGVLIKLNIVSALVRFLLLRIELEYSENITVLRWKGGAYKMNVLYYAVY